MTQQSNITEIQNKIGQFQSFLKVDPKNTELLINLGDLYHSISDFDKAIDCYQQSLNVNDSDIVKSRLASIKISQHQFSDAENLLLELITDGPIDPALEFNLGIAQYQQEKWSEALKRFQHVLDEGVEQESCLAYITRCYHHLSDMQHAKEFGNKWLEKSHSSTSKGYLALMEMDDLNNEKARELAYETLESDPDNEDASVVIGSYLIENQEMEKAVEYFNKVLNKNNKNPRALFALGLTHLYEKNYLQAIDLMESASRLMPKDSGVKVAIGWAKIVNEDIIGAEQTFRDAIEIDRNFSEGHGGLSYALVLQHKFDLAKKEIKAAYRLDKNGFGAAGSISTLKALEQGHEVATKFLADALERPAAPGKEPMIHYLQSYLKKQQPKSLPEK